MNKGIIFLLILTILLSSFVSAIGQEDMSFVPDGYSTNREDYVLAGTADAGALSLTTAGGSLTVSSDTSPNGTNSWKFLCSDGNDCVIGSDNWTAVAATGNVSCEFWYYQADDTDWRVIAMSNPSLTYNQIGTAFAGFIDTPQRVWQKGGTVYTPQSEIAASTWTNWKMNCIGSSTLSCNLTHNYVDGTNYIDMTSGLGVDDLTGVAIFDNNADSTAYVDEIICYEGLNPPAGAAAPITNSSWEITSGNVADFANATGWNTGETVYILSNSSSWTVTASEAVNMSCSGLDANYTTQVAACPTCKATTTDTASQSITYTPDLALGLNTIYCSMIRSDGTGELATSTSGPLLLNLQPSFAIDNSSWNMTSDGGCTVWQTNQSVPCNTTDGTPTILVNTTHAGNLSIKTTEDVFDPVFKCEITGGLAHQCTLDSSLALDYGIQNLYIAGINSFQEVNISSGALAINMTAGGGGSGLVDCIKAIGDGCGVTIEDNCAIIN